MRKVVRVLVAGSTGIGKTSLINCLVGVKDNGGVSDSAYGCTKEPKDFSLLVGDDLEIVFTDVPGFNEPNTPLATASTHKAYTMVKQALRDAVEGFNLILFVTHSGRRTFADQKNVDMFCQILGKNKIPTVMIVNKSESGKKNPNELRSNPWIKKNMPILEEYNDNKNGFFIKAFQETSFIDDTIDCFIPTNIRRELRAISKELVLDLIQKHSSPEPIKTIANREDYLFIALKLMNFVLYNSQKAVSAMSSLVGLFVSDETKDYMFKELEIGKKVEVICELLQKVLDVQKDEAIKEAKDLMDIKTF